MFFSQVCFVFVMLKNKAIANQMLFRLYCIVDQNLSVLFFIHNSLNYDKINTTD